MPQRPLVVHVEESGTDAAWDYVFEESPVVVGRGDDAGLRIDRPFVSLHHGTFDFDDQVVTYVDLDSRNGSLIDGSPRGTDRPIPISDETDIHIGKVRLRVSRTTQAVARGDANNPFASSPRRTAQKETDALPREEVERVRRELLARKSEPPLPVSPVVPPIAAASERLPPISISPAVPVAPASERFPPISVAPAAPVLPAPPTDPAIAKTVLLPTLASAAPGGEDGPSPTATRPASYTAGGTRAVPAREPRASTARPRRSDSQAAVDTDKISRRRAASPGIRGMPAWLPLSVGAGVVIVAALVILLGTGKGHQPRERLDDIAAPAVEAPPRPSAADHALPARNEPEPVRETAPAADEAAPREETIEPPHPRRAEHSKSRKPSGIRKPEPTSTSAPILP